MGIFKFFKKEKPVVEIETISQENLSEWISNKKKQHQEKESEFLVPIKERIAKFISELESGITTLENINLEAKKVDDRIRFIVKENLKNYIEHLEKMIERLKKVEKREEIVNKINFAINDFNKRSQLSYEKTTFLIGKEMKETKESIKKFLADLEKILKSNAKYFEEFEALELIETQNSKLKSIKNNKEELSQELINSSAKLKQLNQNLKDKGKEIQELKESKLFKQEEDKVKKLEFKKQELGRILNNLKQEINFKELLKFYHKFENEMKLVKEYRENFQQTLQSSKSEVLLSLIKEAKLESNKITGLIQKMNHLKQEIKDIKIKDIGLDYLERDLNRISSELDSNKLEESVNKKKLKNVEQDLENVLKKIKHQLKEINIEFV